MDMKPLQKLAVEYKTATPDRRKSIKRSMVDIVAEALEPEASQLVRHIEAKPETTKNHYGDYMRALSQCPDMLTKLGLSKALIDAGASQGVNDALKLV